MQVQFTCPVCEQTVTRPYRATCCSRACGNTLRRRTPRPSSVSIHDDGVTASVPLYAVNGSIKGYTLIDAADAEWAVQWRWSLWPDGYAFRCRRVEETDGGKARYVVTFLHRELMGLVRGDDLEVDHINRDRLDNRRSNLRVVTKQGNRQNMPSHNGSSSRFRGVHWAALQQKWRARIRVNGKNMHLGLFDNEDEAGAAARAARLQYMPFAVD